MGRAFDIGPRTRFLKALSYGLLTHLTGDFHRARRPGELRTTARYCYSVWLRHLVSACQHGIRSFPGAVVELGPGATLGVGLAAVISGARFYTALDVEGRAAGDWNTALFDYIVELFRRRAPIPAEDEFPLLGPPLDCYGFPDCWFGESDPDAALVETRLRALRRSLENLDASDSPIRYIAPWQNDGLAIERNSADMVFSQSVMEFVPDLPETYRATACWLKPGGFVSHEIDYASPRTSIYWNGNWARTELTWKLTRGRRVWWGNREPHSTHIQLLRENGFEIVYQLPLRDSSGLPRHRLAARYSRLSDDDLATRVAYVLAVKPASVG
jgi:hypothetical protein